MVNNLNIIGVIHARGGSKRIPLKNIKLLNGKPLISYTVKAALGSRHLRRVIVSTDHPEIKRISLECGAEVPFIRPERLAEDCPSEWVTRHAVEFVEKEESKKVDIVVTIQPTTPFCMGEDIDACIDVLLLSDKLDSVFSAKAVQERPEWMFKMLDNDRVELFLGGQIKGEAGVSQNLPKLLIPNGAVFVTKRDTLLNDDIIISKKSGAYVMPLERSVDIDEPIDFRFAEFLAQETLKKG